MTLRTCSALVLAVSALTGACGGGVEVSLQLKPAVDQDTREPFDTSALQSLAILLAAEGREKPDEVRVVLDRKKQVPLDGITVDKSRPFTIDVWGCEAPEACGRVNVVFRGCTPEALDLHDTEGAVPVVIQMHPVDDPRLASCPVF